MRTIATAASLLLVLALAACAPPEPAPPPEPGAGSGTQEPEEPDAPCIEGSWALDVPDFVAQSTSYLRSIGIPLDGLDAEGSQVVTIRGGTDPIVDMHTDLTWHAVIQGVAVDVPVQSAGSGEWGFGEKTGDIEVENWAWQVEPEVPGATAPTIPLFEPGEGFQAECSGDSLTLTSPTAPLVGHFTRVE